MDELIQLAESMRQAASLLGDDDPSDESSRAAPPPSSTPSCLATVPASRRCPGGRARILFAVDVVSSPTAAVASAARVASPRRPHAGSAPVDEAVGKLKSVLDNGEGDLDEVVLQAEELMAPLESHYSGWWRWLQWDSVQAVVDASPPRLPPPCRLVFLPPRRRPCRLVLPCSRHHVAGRPGVLLPTRPGSCPRGEVREEGKEIVADLDRLTRGAHVGPTLTQLSHRPKPRSKMLKDLG
uniref:Uncharacterized protein n=1 Tax=Oryza glumipatula TaxID=40148 RepID=A0A0D9ZPP0_9ORYZ